MSNPMSKEEAAEFAKNFRSDDDDIQEYARPCPNCEYHRKRAQRWREEAYKQAGHPLPEREWVGLTDEEQGFVYGSINEAPSRPTPWPRKPFWIAFADAIEAKLKEKNT
tara:strand:+ start:12 stop:338 length:327 start_codon:yes stop_codon:yes gene_type:complete